MGTFGVLLEILTPLEGWVKERGRRLSWGRWRDR